MKVLKPLLLRFIRVRYMVLMRFFFVFIPAVSVCDSALQQALGPADAEAAA